MATRPTTPEGLKPKELIGVPWRLAFLLQSRGWYLRSDVVWEKPNCQPESVADQPTRSYEFLFLFSKNERYKYRIDAAKGVDGRRVRDVWSVKTQPCKEASGHFATFPKELIKPCVLFSTDEGDVVLDPFLGSGTTALVACELERRFLGIELNPKYCEMAVKRISEYSRRTCDNDASNN